MEHEKLAGLATKIAAGITPRKFPDEFAELDPRGEITRIPGGKEVSMYRELEGVFVMIDGDRLFFNQPAFAKFIFYCAKAGVTEVAVMMVFYSLEPKSRTYTLLFNSFFGFPLLPVTVFEVAPEFTASIMGFPPQPSIVLFHLNLVIPKLLLLTGYIGLAMVTFGLVLGLANEARRKHWKGVGGKIGWLLMAWGVAMFGLNLIQHSSNFSLSLATNPVAPISLGAFITGIVVMAVSEGTRGLIEIPSIISHILSYTRILGILLAAVYLSYVLDLIFLRGVSKSPVFAAIGILVLLLGQLFTIGIAILEPGIQGARLIYVEFFSKFYYGNGKIFRPFKTTRKYTTPKFSLETARK